MTVFVCATLGGCSISFAGILRVDRDVSTCGNNCDGSSWNAADVYEYLQDALLDAQDGDEIWVAEGTYLPTEQHCKYDSDCDGGTCNASNECDFTSPREQTFFLQTTSDEAITIRGGFEGDETAIGDRPSGQCTITGLGSQTACDNVVSDCADDPGEYCDFSAGGGAETILSGEIPGSNSYHVVTYSALLRNASTLERVTVSDGQADGTAPDNQGPAVHIRDSSRCMDSRPSLINCVFSNNTALHHGAVNDHSSGATITNCAFLNNDSTQIEVLGDCSQSGDDCTTDDDCGAGETCDGFVPGAQAGALQIHSGETNVTDCLFKNNTSAKEGGAVWASVDSDSSCNGFDPEPTFTRCQFVDNEAEHGGAIFAEETDSLTITDCSFTGNLATDGPGGAVWKENFGTGIPPTCVCPITISGSTFENNDSVDWGGGLYVLGGDVTITDTVFENNESDDGGAVYALPHTEMTVRNCLVVGNNSTGEGGGLVVNAGTDILFENVTVADNDSVNNGAGIKIGPLLAGTDDVDINNCILWNNVATYPGGYDQNLYVAAIGTSDVDVNYTIWEDYPPGVGGCSQIDCFGVMDEDPEFTPAGEYYLDQSTSCAVDTGSCCIDPSCTVNSGCTGAESTTTSCPAELDDLGTTDSSAGAADDNQIDLGYHYPE